MNTLLKKPSTQGWSDIRTSVIVISGCFLLLLITILPQNMKSGSRSESNDLLGYMADHSLVVLNELVDMDSDFTFFAPSKKALGKKLKGVSESDMTEFFEGHIVYNERIFSTSVPANTGISLKTAKGTTIFLEMKEKKGKMTFLIQGVPVLFDNIVVGPRGVVHVIKGLLEDVPTATEVVGASSKKAKPVGDQPTVKKASASSAGQDGGAAKATAQTEPARKPKPQGRPKPNPFDQRNHYKYRNINQCSGHGFVGDDKECHCAALYTGSDCSGLKKVPYKRIVGHKPIVFNKQMFQKMTEIMVRTKAKTLTMFPKLTPEVRKSISDILPPDDPFHGRVFNVCSLVGSSGSLLYFENGPEIDQSDLVIRFNHAPITLYEKFVGSRTDLRISNGEHLGFNERPNEKSLHHLRSKSFLARMLLYEKHFGKKKEMPYLVHPGFTEYVANASLPYIASSGYFAILMAMEVCSNVHLYGFHFSFNQGSRHHYFNNEVPANPNRDTSEYERLKKLEDHGLLKFAEPCLHECYGSSADCEACFGLPMYKVTARQKLTAKQIKMAETLEKERVKFRQWEGPLKREWMFDDAKGLVKKPPQARSGRRRRRGSRRSRRRRSGGGRSSNSRARDRGGSKVEVNIHVGRGQEGSPP